MLTQVYTSEAALTDERPRLQPPRVELFGEERRFELIGWTDAFGSPRALEGLTQRGDSTTPGFAYYLQFRDRQTGRIRRGNLTHGLFTSASARNVEAQRHYRSGVVDPLELDPFARPIREAAR